MRFTSFPLCLVVALAGCQSPTHPVVLDAANTPDRATQDTPARDLLSLDTQGDVTDATLPDRTVVVSDLPSSDAQGDSSPGDTSLEDSSPGDTLGDVMGELAAPDAGMDALTDLGLRDAPSSDAPDLGAWMPLGDGTCNARARSVPLQSGLHVDPDAGPIMWLTNPPSSGPHFGAWARWGAWPEIPRGNWVHNLEHGGVVMLYRCPTGTCESTRDALVAALTVIPTDMACMPSDAEPTRVRVVITRDNEITSPIAAAAWGALYEADCVYPASLSLFYTMYAGRAPENFCADGFIP